MPKPVKWGMEVGEFIESKLPGGKKKRKKVNRTPADLTVCRMTAIQLHYTKTSGY